LAVITRPWAVFDRRLAVLLTLTFVAATIVGTQTHEFGHYLVARALGYPATMHIGYTDWEDPGTLPLALGGLDRLLITLGGPGQTVLTGTLGLWLILLNRASFEKASRLAPGQWVLVFLALFWMRQSFNLATGLMGGLHLGHGHGHGDEAVISHMLDLPGPSLDLLGGLLGIGVAYIVVFKYIPLKQRLTFLVSGLIGGTVGFVFWIGCLMTYPKH
jgi:hypothetical protein